MKSKIDISLLLISFSLFLYQVCLLRIFSIADYYHFAFMIVSISLLGFGISGSFLYFFIGKIKNPDLILLIFSFGFSVSIITSFLASNFIPFDSFKIAWEMKQIFYLAVYYIFLVLPFFFGGSFIGYAFYRQEKPGLTYFYNLIGSAAGAIIAIFIMQLMGKDGAIYISTAVGLIATVVLINKKYLKTFTSLIFIFVVLITSVIVFQPQIMEIRMSPYKSLPTYLRFPDSKVIYSKENSYARLDIIESPSIKSAPGISLQYQKVPPPQIGITIDGDNLSAVTRIENNVTELEFMEFLPISIFFTVKPEPEKVLVVEPEGGMDVAGALYFDGKNIYVSQNSSLIVDVLKDNFSGYSGNIYNNKRVKVCEVSSRNFSKTTDQKFDLIIISLSDSFHPISAGAYSLNENYLYTVESISDLVGILKEDGVLAVTRWVQFPPSENLKVLSTLCESLDNLKIGEIPQKVFAYRSWSTLTTLLKKDGFDENEINHLKEEVKKLNFDIVYYNGVGQDEVNIYNILEEPYFYNYYKEIIEGNSGSRETFYKNYYFNIYPSRDDKPYFFNFFRFGQVPDIIKYFGKSTQPFGGGGYLILVAALLVSIILSVFFILLPLWIKKINISIRRDFKYMVYFFCLGFGFFFIELPFIQKFILVLGKPAYALSVVLFSIMLSAGVGSFISSRFKVDLRWVVAVIVIYVALFIFTFRFVGDFIISKVLWQRFLYSILLIIPLGFVMGIPFPLAIAKVKEKREEIVPWLWAINGCTSVVGSIAAVIISIHFGFFAVIGMAALIYIAALVTYRYF
ncbi:MAG: hypothetical protein KJ821_02950 [Actinobacteria bacterium]|nr:hypothetical protein [Actinomycetota bacterium]